MKICSKCKQVINEPTPVWYIENELFVYQQYDSREECLTVFKAMKPKNPNLKMKKTNSNCVLYPFYSDGFNF